MQNCNYKFQNFHTHSNLMTISVCYPQNFIINNIAFTLEKIYEAWSISTNDFKKNNKSKK
jgi:hypothetical protein